MREVQRHLFQVTCYVFALALAAPANKPVKIAAPTIKPSKLPTSSPTAGTFVDCTEACLFPNTYIVKPVTPVLFVNLPQTFKMKFEYQCPGSPSMTETGNIFDIYSFSNKKSLLSVYLMMNSNQIGIDYNGVTVMKYGPPVSYSYNSFTKFTITVTETQLVLDNGGYDQWVPITQSVASEENVIYFSSKIYDARHVSALGTIRNIHFEGPLCCASTSYYTTNWEECPSAADSYVPALTSCASCAAYQCLDWTAGSAGMQYREESYFNNSGDSVYFGVGSYGNDAKRAGKCYRITTDSIDRDLIVQVVNQGLDVPDGNFDLMLADGGFGLFDACTAPASNNPQFYGKSNLWGDVFGGWSTLAGCDSIPERPVCGKKPMDNMRDLCRWSFAKGFRKTDGFSNPTILQMCEVSCPDELWAATGLHRADENTNSFTCDGSTPTIIPINATTGLPNGFLTRMMDCAKPSYAWAYNVLGPTYPGSSAVVPCRRDGYSRINSIPTLAPTPMPTYPNTYIPTGKPTRPPTLHPSLRPTSEPTDVPTLPPTFTVTNDSTMHSKSFSSSSKSSSVPAYMDISSPYIATALAVFVMILFIGSVICICERRLHAEKFRELNEKKAKKAKTREENRRSAAASLAIVTAPLLVHNNNNSTPNATNNNEKKSPIQKIMPFLSSSPNRKAAMSDMEVIL